MGDMSIATSVDARGDSSHRKRQVLRRWWIAMCHRNLFHYDLRVCTELHVLSKTASRLWFYAYKKSRTVKSARRTALQRNIRPSITQDGSDDFSSGISGKTTKNSNFKRHFLENGWSYRREILHDNLEDHAQRHISKLCSFLYHFKR